MNIPFLNRLIAGNSSPVPVSERRVILTEQAAEAGRVLAELATMTERERYRARARIMCQQQGKPVPACLEPRG